jgi:hypothetical protein
MPLLWLATLQPAISLMLRVFGYRRTRAMLERLSPQSYPHSASEHEWAGAERLAELARIAGRHGLTETTCLRQSLAVYWCLRRRGLKPDLRLGVGRLDGAMPDMHAWVELDGRPLAQPNARHVAFPARTASRHADTAATTSGKRV